MKYRYFAVIVLGIVEAVAASAEASLIANGDFESVTNNQFDSWTYGGPGAYVESSEVISGAHSAGILKGGGSFSYLEQYPSEALSNFVFECDFAVFPVASNRSMNIQLFYKPTGGGMTQMVNLRVGPNNYLQAYDGDPSSGGSWKNLGSLTALTTTDIGNDGIWNGETPVVNHLMVLGRWAPTGSTYDVILNGVSVSGITYFQGGPPNSTAHTLRYIWLFGNVSDANWLVDNVVLYPIPEPTTGILFGIGAVLGLGGLGWRRRPPAGALAGRNLLRQVDKSNRGD